MLVVYCAVLLSKILRFLVIKLERMTMHYKVQNKTIEKSNGLFKTHQ